MKKLSTIFLFIFLFSFAALAQDIDKTPSITVTGNAEVLVQPDEVIFSLDVTKTNLDLQKAKSLNDEAVGKVLELTRRFGVTPQNVKTDYISVEMKYESIRDNKTRIYDEDGDEVGKRIFKGYEVSKTVIVKLTDITKFEQFFSEVLKTGITEINSIKFETSKLRENKDKAREMAMIAAKEKAAEMTKAVGQSIGKAIRIVEGTVSNQAVSYGAMSNASANAVSSSGIFSSNVATFAPGAIKVEASVTVTFALN